MKCTIPEFDKTSEHCKSCKDQICRKYPVIDHILGSNDFIKIRGLNEVMSKYHLKVSNYV